MSRRFEEADRIAAALGEPGLRRRIAAAEDAIGNAAWTGLPMRLSLALALWITAFNIGWFVPWPWWLKAAAGLAAYALLVTPVVVLARRRRAPGEVEPMPHATPEALMDAFDAAFTALPKAHRRRGHVLHARARAAQVWAGEERGVAAPVWPLTRRQRTAARKLHRLVHRLAETTTDGPAREYALRDLARWERALDHVSGRADTTIVWTIIVGLAPAVVATGWPGVAAFGIALNGATSMTTTECPYSIEFGLPGTDRAVVVREFAEAFPELAALVRA